MTKLYCVYTWYNGECGTDVFEGSKRECNSYVKQAIKKGADPACLVILPCGRV